MPNTGIPAFLRGLEARATCPGSTLMTIASTFWLDDVLDAADHRRDVALGVDDVDVPTLGLGRLLKGLDVELGAGLGEIGRDHGDLRGQSRVCGDRERQ